MDDSENTPQQAIVLTIRPSSGSTFTTAISTDSTVLQLKEKLATPELPVASIRLVYSGRVLNDDDQLSFYSIQEGHTIHMVKSASNRASEQAVQTARPLNNNTNNLGGPEGFDEQRMLSSLLDNPAIRDMMANPEVVRRMMMSNPQTREVMENNPEVAQMLNDPSFLRQSLDMARNPKLMKQALRNNDRALSNLEMVPGGFNHLRRMYRSVQEPMEASRSAPQPSTDDLNERFAAQLNADTRPNAGALNTTALPNPWAPRPQARANPMFPGFGMPGMGGSSGAMGGFNPFASLGGAPGFPTSSGSTSGGAPNPFGLPPLGEGSMPPLGNNPEMFQQMMQFNQMMRQMQQQSPGQAGPGLPPSMFSNMFGSPFPMDTFGGANATSTTPSTTTSAAPVQAPEERFETQLASLREMGFSDQSRNIRALLASGGDVPSAIEFLLRM
ncbi:Ubiquilin-4 [Podila epicladia]|nr:Ubiquilin-4 [Podila epicladia]